MRTLTHWLVVVGLLAIALGLTACAGMGATQSLQASPRSGGHIDAVGTLAVLGTCEYEIAPDYTAVIAARRKAAAELRGGTMSLATAQDVQRLADQARAALDMACPKGTLDPLAVARARGIIRELRGLTAR